MEALEVRLTRNFVGTWQHEDEWGVIGTFDRIFTEMVSEDREDPCEPQTMRHIVRISCDEPQPKDRVVRALNDSNTIAGCSHEYDCCGCRSYYATARHLVEDLYEVMIDSSRNY